MNRILYSFLCITALFFLMDCAALNEDLDSANEAAREAGKPVGKVLNIPGSAAQGAAEGMIEKEKDPNNPFNR